MFSAEEFREFLEDVVPVPWQFRDRMSRRWNVRVIQDEKWTHFEMKPGKPAHRETFLAGSVPDGAKIIESA